MQFRVWWCGGLVAVWLWAGVVPVTAERGSGAHVEAPAVAVVGFATLEAGDGDGDADAAGGLDSPAQGAGVDDPAAGLADLLELALRDRGVALIERRSLGPVLAERRLRRWLGDPEQGELPPLPGADGLIVGQLALDGTGAMTLTARLLEARTGVQRSAVSAPCGAHDLLPEAVDALAEALVAEMDVDAGASDPPRRLPGFSDGPEAVLNFYRGLDHLSRGQLAWAVAYLLEAGYHQDSDFYLARAWAIRALVAAGLPHFAWHLEDGFDLRGRPELEALMALLHRDADGERTGWVVPGEGTSPDAARAFEVAVDAHPKLALLAPAYFQRVVAERDLKLSGEFDAPPMAVDRWLFTDWLLEVTPGALTRRDAVTGQALATVTREGGDADASPAALLDQLLAAAPPPRDLSLVPADQVPLPPQPATVSPFGTQWYPGRDLDYEEDRIVESLPPSRVYRNATVLAHLLEEPNNISVLYAVGETWNSAYTPAAHARIIRLIDRHRDLPDAPAWLSTTLFRAHDWRMNHDRFESVTDRIEREPTQAERYAGLRAWFPDSGEALLTEYGIAHERIDAGDSAQAVAHLERLTSGLKNISLVQGASLHPELGGSIWFFLARERFKLGRLAEARAALDRCQQIIGEGTSEITPYYETAMHCAASRVAFHTCGSRAHTLRAYEVLRTADFKDLRPQVRALAQRLAAAEAGEQEAGPYHGSRELFCAAVHAATEAEAFDLHWRSVEAHLAERSIGRATPPRVVQQLAWLRLRCRDDLQLARWHDLIAEVLHESRAGAYDAWYDLMMLAGRWDELQNTLDEQLTPDQPYVRAHALLRQLQYDSLRYGDREQLERLLPRVASFEADFAKRIRERSLAYGYAVEQLATPLILLGRPDLVIERLSAFVDHEKVPARYRARTALKLAEAMALNGQMAEATALFKWVAEVSGHREGGEVVWPMGREAANRDGLWMYRRLKPTDPHTLFYEARYHLRRLRVYAGQPTVLNLSRRQPPEWDAPFT